jgi:hypothetical protein
MMQVDIENTFNIFSRIIIFRELCDVEGLLVNIVSFTRLFHGVHSSFTTNMGGLWRGSPLLNYLQAPSKVTP